MQRVGLNLKNVINLTVVVDANYSWELLFGSTNYYFKWNWWEKKNVNKKLLLIYYYALSAMLMKTFTFWNPMAESYTLY